MEIKKEKIQKVLGKVSDLIQEIDYGTITIELNKSQKRIDILHTHRERLDDIKDNG